MRIGVFRSILAIAALLASYSLRAATMADIPFEYRDGLIWLNVTVSAQAEPLHFLLDSGAEASVLNAQTARRLGLKLGRPQSVQGVNAQATAYRVNRFEARTGPIALPGSMLALDLGAVSAMCHQPIDGLLGADFFRGRIVQIDFRAGRIRLLDEAQPGGHSTILPLKVRNGIFCAPVNVADSPAQWMRIDTGCDSALEWAANHAVKYGDGPSIGLTRSSDRSITAAVQLGSLCVRDVKVGLHDRQIFPGEAGLLGNGLLFGFRVTVDARTRRLILE
jgi:hypothetical protein